ncbi:BlaI/MecI/CopY family transcriptional regulator [Lentzea sp. BCCO 10_0798]|uniref:BlaI/MecI/CopY family transcriptional regulator n=1 Tax=Lentzea kristufekii TaxID=3095430 RepID=A0ABU4TZQ9_9PSEU|nr:BlaI/MecI/CopY family transcriptional regulator [Lentzea sp. BCCO 10_0798]MDX8053741.1 BlaI/MecI/CopY family transcriptional regulator [Lentzea sp. BCCO 10_0798]
MQGLGELESAVMDVLWRGDGDRTVRDVLDELSQERELAYTTVMTVLDNLHRKGWVERVKVSRAFHYRAVMTRAEAEARALRAVLESTDDPESVLLHFAQSATEEEASVLRKALRKRR